jgi:phytoene/squalene synthetase
LAGPDLTGTAPEAGQSLLLSLAGRAAGRGPAGARHRLPPRARRRHHRGYSPSARDDRLRHLTALRDELDGSAPGRLDAIVAATRPGQTLPAERELIDRLPDALAAYRALAAADRGRARRVLGTIVEGMTWDLTAFPGEDAAGLAALETRAELDRYTYLVAGAVGEFWTEVHMAHRPRLRGWDPAKMSALGVRFGKGLQSPMSCATFPVISVRGAAISRAAT